jgi:hypothetical protein
MSRIPPSTNLERRRSRPELFANEPWHFNALRVLALVALAYCAMAQTNAPEDFFHRGAQNYVHDKKKQAEQEIVTGLQLFPTDPLLNGMAVLLKKEEEKQRQQQQNQQQQQQDQNQQQQQSQQQEQQQPQGQQGQTNQQQQAQSEPQEQQEKEKQEQASGSQQEPQGRQQEEQAETPKPGEMTPQEARQLLDTQKEEEKMLPVRPDAKAAERSRHLRDW